MPQLTLIRNIMEARKREIIPAAIGDRVLDLVPRDFPIERCDIVCTGKYIEHPKDFLVTHTFTRESEDVILRVVPGAATFFISLAVGLVLMGLSYAIQALIPPPKIENRQTFDNSENSPTYGWQGIQNTTRNGAPVQCVDGWHKVGGQILSAYTDVTDDNRHELFMLIQLSEGPVGAINGFTEDTSPTNGSGEDWEGSKAYTVGEIVRPLTRTQWQYTCTTAGTSGTTEPTWDTEFGGTTSDGTVTWTTGFGEEGLTGDDIDDGLTINGTPGRIFDGLRVYYRMGSWEQRPIPGFHDAQIEYPQDEQLAYDDAVTYVTQDRVDALRFIFSFGSGLYAINENGAFFQKSVEFQIRYRVYGESTWSPIQLFTLTGKSRSVQIRKHELEGLQAARYEVEITRRTADDDAYTVSTVSLSGVVESRYDDVTRCGQALCAIRHVANEQLSGQTPTVNNIVHGKKRIVYQPGDEFGEDTQQDFNTGRAALLWGWNSYIESNNRAAIGHAASHTYGYRTLGCKHAEATSDPAGTTPSCPFFYKELYNDFTLTVKCNGVGSPTVGDGLGIMFMDSTNASDYAFCAIENYGGTIQARVQNEILSQSETTYEGTTLTLPYYLRLVRSGSVWTFYRSSDGVTFTELGDITFLPSADPVRVGLCYYSTTSTTGDWRPVFSEFEFSDETGYSIETTSSPAWTVYGYLTETYWSLGDYIDQLKIDTDTFIGFANYAKVLVDNGAGDYHRRYAYDGVTDTPRGAWEFLLGILENYRATMNKQGHNIRVAWLKVHTGPPVQIFGDANTKRNTLVTADQSNRLGHNVYEAQYLNRALDYDQDFEPYQDPDLEEGEAFRREVGQHYGVVRIAEARRIGLYKTKRSHYQRTTCRFETSVKGIRCEPYDVIEVSARMLGVGESGYVVHGSRTSITLDKPVTIETGYTYAIKIHHSADDSVETVAVTSDIGVRSILAIEELDLSAEKEDEWFFGRTNIVTKPFEVTKIEYTGSLECRIEGALYVAGVYDETITKIPQTIHTSLPDPRAVPGDVSDIVTSERAEVMPDGTIRNVVDVTFRAGSNAVAYDIYYREQGELGWVLAGTSKGLHYVLAAEFTVGTTYEIAVVSVGRWGAKKRPAELADPRVPMDTITIVGKTTRPPDVSSLTVVMVGESLVFRWGFVAGDDILGYEIRYADGNVWELDAGATTLAFVGSKANSTNAPAFVPGATKWFHVRAVNTSGLYSENSAAVQYTIPAIPDETTAVVRDEATNSWNGTKTNFTISGSDILQDASTTSASYVTPDGALDAGSSAQRRVHVDLAHSASTPSYTWADAPFTWDSAIAGDYTWEGPREGTITLQILIRYGDTTPLTGDYETLVQDGFYTARYYQIKISVTTTSTMTRTLIEDMVTTITE